jgi:hypothetical protein
MLPFVGYFILLSAAFVVRNSGSLRCLRRLGRKDEYDDGGNIRDHFINIARDRQILKKRNTGIHSRKSFHQSKKQCCQKDAPRLPLSKINTAKAKNPYPATVALKFVDVGTTKINPPIPARNLKS